MKKLSLNGIWKMTGNGYAVNGTIPGSVYSFLYLDNKLLPDPYYRDNEKIYLELASHEYAFERTFSHTPTGDPTFLVFEGLDTLCSVYLNGEKIADTDNMHVRYDFDVTNLLTAGENNLRVVCHPVPPLYPNEKSGKETLWRVRLHGGLSARKKSALYDGLGLGPSASRRRHLARRIFIGTKQRETYRRSRYPTP